MCSLLTFSYDLSDEGIKGYMHDLFNKFILKQCRILLYKDSFVLRFSKR